MRDVPSAVGYDRDRMGFTPCHVEAGFAILCRDEGEIHLWAANRPRVPSAEPHLAGTASCRVRVRGVRTRFAEYSGQRVVHPNGALAVQSWGVEDFTALDANGNAIASCEPTASRRRHRARGSLWRQVAGCGIVGAGSPNVVGPSDHEPLAWSVRAATRLPLARAIDSGARQAAPAGLDRRAASDDGSPDTWERASLSGGLVPSDRSAAVVPPPVERAAALAERLGLVHSCAPEVGRLLAVLAAGVRHGLVGELGTGCVVGTAWLASALAPGTDLLTIDHDPMRAAAARELFGSLPRVRTLTGDWRVFLPRGPFDLLFVDAADAKRRDPALVIDALRPGAMVVLDDFSPKGHEPPDLRGKPDRVRESWLRHPRLLATEVSVSGSMVAILASRVA